MAEILSIRLKTLFDQSFNQSTVITTCVVYGVLYLVIVKLYTCIYKHALLYTHCTVPCDSKAYTLDYIHVYISMLCCVHTVLYLVIVKLIRQIIYMYI